MNFGKAFTFVFEDPDWFKKVLIIGLITLIPVVGQLVLLGWAMEITKKVVNKEPTLLPDIDFGKQLGTGFKLFVVSLVYMAPILVLVLIQVAIQGGLTVAAGSMDNQDLGGAMGVGVIILSLCFGLFYLVYGLLVGFALPAAYTKTVLTDSIGAGLKFGEILGIVKKAIVPYLIVILGSILSSTIASLGSVACGVGMLLTVPYAMLINSHLYGQAYLEATEPKAV